MTFKKILKTLTLGLLTLALCSCTKAQNSWDWYIKGGKIVDGTGADAYQADILIRADSIAYIGKVDSDTVHVAHTYDASGQVVTPGFIDVHAHGNPLKTPEFHNFLGMGVTTIILGQDGSSSYSGSLSSWFDKVEKAHPAVNIAVLTGHGSLHSKAGARKKPATPQQLKRMKGYLEKDLQAGAFGMSTGLEYVPGLYADENELVGLAEVVGKYDGLIMSHMRSEDDSKMETSLKELAKQGEKARVHASHLKVVYGKGADRADEILQEIANYNKQGITFTAGTYPYAASYTGIAIVFPKWAKTTSEWKQVMKERPKELRQYLSAKIKKRNGPDAVLFGSGKYAGKTLQQASKQENMSPVDLLLKMGPQSASAAHFVMDEALQDRIATAPGIMICSDGSPGIYHPRGYGSFAKVIHRYVDEQKKLTIEQAVHKMSGLSAHTIRLPKRGTLKVGNKADILVFDPEEVRDIATYSKPHQIARGFNWIWVNGKLVRSEGSFNGTSAGRVLKKKSNKSLPK